MARELLDDIIMTAGLASGGKEALALEQGLRALFSLAGTESVGSHLSENFPDYLTAAIDEKISEQLNEILHHPDFIAVEAVWRGLHFLVERVNFSQNILLEYLSVSQNDLFMDFEDASEISKSGLYKHVYTEEFGQFGGQPVAAIIADYTFGVNPRDLQLLQYIGNVAALAHAPCFAAAGKGFFGIDRWSRLPDLRDLKSIFDMPGHARWNALRDTDIARYIGLTLPGFLLRLPYGPENSSARVSFNFTEKSENEDQFCWGNAAFALAVCLANSFARYRWCVNIIGPDGGGAVGQLPCCRYAAMGGTQSKIPTRAVISEHREYELANLGFISLATGRTPDEGIFFSANSIMKPRIFPKTPEGLAEEISFRLSTQFPYMMIMNRLAHYVKVLQREGIGSWRSKEDLARELNEWISRYVTAMDTPDALTRSRRPLRAAHIEVRDLAEDSGWYAVSIRARPHFKYMGVNFTLSLEGRLEKQTDVSGDRSGQ
ncbi:MAG: type VI secretion system contractile sheath large subunit [Deltaproteobacteria bacterium]|jgi:type VI secretion system protein ImpC|nr:type VI secretion system contractile sheath large subunit [Deltaproteobacteria bacterium]